MKPSSHWQDDVLAGPGGAMTDEVGVITGPLTLRTTWEDDGDVRLEVQYTGADEWYTLTGSPLPAIREKDAHALHTATLTAVKNGHGATAPATSA
ncbi:hypothetical protein AMK16_01925 [Streptomyces sp. CB00455]|uniref:hypothetical protein n=1 Tax=Streptomyces sp. CB00455 TaxID=1703927 RepID=UPI0009404B49|nr:hypothetical protein [Streptomyces sp. CB00455]OKK22021.1 hypothetical protein AMK16_01925 [Streptomyces sp. CB00455]